MKEIAKACIKLISQDKFTAADVANKAGDMTVRQAAMGLRTMIDKGVIEYVKTKPAIYRIVDSEHLMEILDGTVERRSMQRAHALLSLFHPVLPPRRDADHEYRERHTPDATTILHLPRRAVCLESNI